MRIISNNTFCHSGVFRRQQMRVEMWKDLDDYVGIPGRMSPRRFYSHKISISHGIWSNKMQPSHTVDI